MRVLVDLRWMFPGYSGGIERMARSFFKVLSGIDTQNEYQILLPKEARNGILVEDFNRIAVHSSNGIVYFIDRFFRHLLTRVTENSDFLSTSTAVQRLKSRSDVGLSLSGYIYPDLFDLDHVVVVSDIQHEFFPEFFTPIELERRRTAFTTSINKAKVICAVSEFTRDSLIERLGIPPGKIRVVYEAADPIFSLPIAQKTIDQIMEKYGLPKGEYLFYPANTWFHKNHISLLKAIKLLENRSGLTPLLVCTGTPKEAHEEIISQIEALKLGDRVRFLGYCQFEELPAIYQGAAVLVFPSLFEGFGLPILEAMTVGCPVVCSNGTSLPEIAGEAASFFDPNSIEQISNQIEKVLLDEDLQSKLITSGYKQIEGFSWGDFAKKIDLELRI